jgi:hypothetical protein
VKRYIFRLTISDDYVAWDYWPNVEPDTCEGCAFLDTESMGITEIPLYFSSEMVNGMLVRRDYKNNTVNISNPKFHWIVNEEDGFSARQISCGSELIVCYSTSRHREERIEVWKMGNPPTLLRTRTSEYRKLRILKVDERFIVASFAHKSDLYFISTETLEVFTSVSVRDYQCDLYEGSSIFASASGGRLMNLEFQYAQGLLFEYRGNGLVRILDVTSKKYVNNVRIPFHSKDDKFLKLLDEWVSLNSKVIVIGWKYSKNRYRRVSHLSVFDLEAVKKPNSDPGTHLLYTLQFQFDIHSFVMNESEIAFSGSKDPLEDWYVTVLKFANFSFAERKSSVFKENPESHKDSMKRIVQMKMRKIVHDCVDFDAEVDDDDEDQDEEDEKYEEYIKYEEMEKKKKKKKNVKK